jgi:hypothetical protein
VKTRFAGTIALFALAAAVAPASSAQLERARVRIAKVSPLTVAGTGFQRLEGVRLVVLVGENELGSAVSASAAGSFRLTIQTEAIDRCTDSIIVRATGAKGSRARALMAQLRCPPKPDPTSG